jgi:hypothetical protein
MDVYIGFTSLRNSFAWKDIPPDKMDLYNRYIWKKVHIEERVPNTKWVVLRFPSAAMAQNAGMSEEAFEDFYFDVCTMDYAKMSKAMDSLVGLMRRSDRVRIAGPDTDLRFSIKGMPAIKCDGSMNIPDGEVYTAPLRGSVEGFVRYNAPSEKDGFKFENVRLEFRKGKIISASANDSGRINSMLDIDEGARRIRPWTEPLYYPAAPGHPLRRKNSGFRPHNPGQLLRRLLQWQPLQPALGSGTHAGCGIRGRGDLVRRQACAERRTFCAARTGRPQSRESALRIDGAAGARRARARYVPGAFSRKAPSYPKRPSVTTRFGELREGLSG